MNSIKVLSAHFIKVANCVVISGDSCGAIKTGDILFNKDNEDETYSVKGLSIVKLKDGAGSSIDVQLQTGNYEPNSLIGKILIAR